MGATTSVIDDLKTEQRKFVSVQELAEYWGVSTKTLYRHIDKGALAAEKIGGCVRIPIAAARSYGNPRGHVDAANA